MSKVGIRGMGAIIKLMSRQSGEGSRTEPTLATIEVSPEKEQWAIINKFKALEFERMKARERSIDRQKKQYYRRQLDDQLNSRNNSESMEREQDRFYYQQLSQLSQQKRQEEEANKRDRFMQRKNVDLLNNYKLEESRQRMKDGDTGYHLEIGVQSELEHKNKSNQFRKDMMDTLDLQLKQKDEEVRKNKMKSLQADQIHKKIQENYFKPQQRKLYSQNQKIFQYYNQLQSQRQLKEHQLDTKYVEEARERRQHFQVQKQRQEQAKKKATQQIVKQTLGIQVKQLQRKKIEESTTNPQDLSYGFISSVFEPKYQGYDKEQYKRELRQQAEQQRLRKVKENHMSQEEYKLNMNQLSKAVMGEYAQKNYLDRSLGAIGDNKKFQLDATPQVKDKDAEVIKKRLSTLRNRGVVSYLQ